jgi:hypothetical protein
MAYTIKTTTLAFFAMMDFALLWSPANAQQPLTPDQVKQLRSVSQALLVSKAKTKDQIQTQLAEDRLAVDNVAKALDTLESSVITAMMNVSVGAPNQSLATSKTQLNLVQQNAPIARLDPTTKTFEPVVPKAQGQTIASQSTTNTTQTMPGSSARGMQKDRAKQAVSQTRAALQERRLSLEQQVGSTNDGSLLNWLSSLFSPSTKSSSDNDRGSAARKQQLIAVLQEVDADLAKIENQNTIDIDALRAVRKKVTLVHKEHTVDEVQPTFQTITKHRQ